MTEILTIQLIPFLLKLLDKPLLLAAYLILSGLIFYAIIGLFQGKDLTWRRVAIFFILLRVVSILSDCQSKLKAAAASSVVIQVDTTRLRLKRQVDSSGNVLVTITQKTDSTLSEHEKAVQRYDAIRVALP